MCRGTLAAVMVVGIMSGGLVHGELADPTRPAIVRPRRTTSPAAADGALILRSVLLSEHGSVAVINGRRVHIGDRVFGTRVVEISLSGVRLQRKDGDVVLKLLGAGFKKDSRRRWSSR